MHLGYGRFLRKMIKDKEIQYFFAVSILFYYVFYKFRWCSLQDRRYADLTEDQLPSCESLKDTIARALPFWNEEIAPQIKQGKRVLIAAHGNSLRGIVKHLEGGWHYEIFPASNKEIQVVFQNTIYYCPSLKFYHNDLMLSTSLVRIVHTALFNGIPLKLNCVCLAATCRNVR